ncbi:mitochondrial carrier domain-containing protein [Mariannaea sp. PMI_226]|nr:mitochondrial carrier domain-containing protein [Mariannaea sp. PMI_226]
MMATLASPSSSCEPTTRIVDAGSAVKKAHYSPVVSLIAGGVAGAVEATATYPFEYAKTRLQLERKTVGSSANPLTMLLHTTRNDGFRSIYTGCSTLILGTTFKAAVRFLSFDSIRNTLADETGRLTPGRGILAGMIAGCAESVVAVTPTERIKTALIDDANSAVRRYHGGIHATRTIIREAGISEIYRGLVSTTLKQSATSAARMGSYNVLKDLCEQSNIPRNSAVTFATGAVAGVITVYVTQPFDTIKTKSQSARGASTIEACRMVFSESGIRGFWRGSSMRLARLVFSGGIVFTVYEKVALFLTR